ncbi:MAG: hypothetical protein IJ224_02970 [Lachnospiraceae bacterium]|nr:hypothetical protein [Lachnospiraceae bacterium]
MYRPSKYDKHNETMEQFAKMFNDSKVCPNVKMRPNEEETYDNDGIFIDVETGEYIGFDWEYRDKYFSNGKLSFKEIGQYERKIKKPSIQLALQCDSTVTSVAAAWHNDFYNEDIETKSLSTDYAEKQIGDVRYTKKYKIYSFNEIDKFKHMVSRAIKKQLFSFEVFSMND